MADIDRYDHLLMGHDNDCLYSAMDYHKTGDYVKYEDHKSIVDVKDYEIQLLKNDLRSAQKALEAKWNE